MAHRSPTCPNRCSSCGERCCVMRAASGSWRKVLAIVPRSGLDAVLVALELALETGPPSGRVSVEHVVNVLGRLNATPRQESAATTLQFSEPPLADTARYYNLGPLDDTEEIDHA